MAVKTWHANELPLTTGESDMNARMAIVEPRPEHVDEVVGVWDDETVAQITGQQGNRGLFLFRDVANGRVGAVCLWGSDADADAAGLAFRRHTASVSGYLASPSQVERLEDTVASRAVLSTGSI